MYADVFMVILFDSSLVPVDTSNTSKKIFFIFVIFDGMNILL